MIAGRPHRIAIVGASSLAGKELNDALAESAFSACDVALLDVEDAAGQVTSAGDEISFIQKLDAESFAGIDFAFFAGDAATTRSYWKAARLAGASIIDMTYALEAEPGVVVRGGWAGVAAGTQVKEPDLTTPAVVSAHPAALALLLLSRRLQARLPVRALCATAFEPASQHGRAAMDELHQQTVSLLSFQSVPREQFDAQVAFNLVPALGAAAKVKLEEARERIAIHYATLSSGTAPELILQLVQAPVFHGYVASVLVELEATASLTQLEAAVQGAPVDVVSAESDPPSNVSAAGQADVLAKLSPAGGSDDASERFWLWMAVDNLKLAALNAIACASELGRLRPQGKVQ